MTVPLRTTKQVNAFLTDYWPITSIGAIASSFVVLFSIVLNPTWIIINWYTWFRCTLDSEFSKHCSQEFPDPIDSLFGISELLTVNFELIGVIGATVLSLYGFCFGYYGLFADQLYNIGSFSTVLIFDKV